MHYDLTFFLFFFKLHIICDATLCEQMCAFILIVCMPPVSRELLHNVSRKKKNEKMAFVLVRHTIPTVMDHVLY